LGAQDLVVAAVGVTMMTQEVRIHLAVLRSKTTQLAMKRLTLTILTLLTTQLLQMMVKARLSKLTVSEMPESLFIDHRLATVGLHSLKIASS